MSHVAWSVCLLGIRVSPAKTAIEMPFGGANSSGPKASCIRLGSRLDESIRAMRGDKTAVQPVIQSFDQLFSYSANKQT